MPGLLRLLARRRAERLVLVEDVALELLERRAGLDPELLRERPPGVGVGVERVRLTAAAVEREHLLPAQALAQGMAANHRLELGGDLAVTAEREIRLDAILERRQPELLERTRRALCERLAREIGQRCAAPERERLAQVARRGLRAAGDELLARTPDRRFEAVEVELPRSDVEDVPGRPRDEHAALAARRPLGLDQLAQLRDVAVQCRDGGARRLVAPQLVDEAIGGHDLIGLEQQECEQAALLETAERKRAAFAPDLERAQDPELDRALHAAKLTRRERPRERFQRPFSPTVGRL